MTQAHKFATAVLLVFSALMMCPATANAQFARGEKSIGAKTGYAGKNESLAIGMIFQYSISNHIRLSPELGWAIKHHGLDAFNLDLNVHTPFTFTGERVALYPLAGLNYSSWNKVFHDGTKQQSLHHSRFGVNFGAGFEIRCGRRLKLGFEGRYTLIKSYSGSTLCAVFGYIF